MAGEKHRAVITSFIFISWTLTSNESLMLPENYTLVPIHSVSICLWNMMSVKHHTFLLFKHAVLFLFSLSLDNHGFCFTQKRGKFPLPTTPTTCTVPIIGFLPATVKESLKLRFPQGHYCSSSFFLWASLTFSLFDTYFPWLLFSFSSFNPFLSF
jgi:hypothetical protein